MRAIKQVNKITRHKEKISVGLEVILVPQGDQFVAYCPALELSSYGDNMDEAYTAFGEALSIFLDDTAEKGTFEAVLIRLGWTLSKKEYVPPRIPLRKSMHAEKIINERVAFPAVA